jgi:excisionase family DNA binding protein
VTEGVTVPSPLCRAVARLAVLGLAELARRDGGAPPAPGLAALLCALDAAATGSPVGRVEPVPVTVTEAAALAGVSPRRVRQLAASGRLRARRHGRAWLIDRDSASDYGKDRH